MKHLARLFGVALALFISGRAFAAGTSTLPDNRILQFNDYAQTNNLPSPTWVHEGPSPFGTSAIRALLSGTNHYHRTGWNLFSCRTGTARGLGFGVSPNLSTNFAANLQNSLDARIESPVFRDGIGTIYFEAINNAATNWITVEIATNMFSSVDGTNVSEMADVESNGLSYAWTTLDEVTLDATAASEFTRYRRQMNCRVPAKLRIRRSGAIYSDYPLDRYFAVIDNIRVSLPPSDVVIAKPECLFDPGYPAVGSNLTVRCVVSNVDTNAPTDSRAVKVCSRWRHLDQAAGPWRTNGMAYVEGSGDGKGNGEVYQAVLPPQGEEGDLEYYFICEFSGVEYVSPDYTQTGFNGYPYPSESVSPRVLRGSPADYSVRIRPFASRYGNVWLEGDQLGEPVAMTLVGDDLWRAMIPAGSLGLSRLTWRFKGTGAYTPGADASATGVTYWAGAEPAGARFVPLGGVCTETDGAGRLGLSCDAAGCVMVTLNTRTLEYRACRAEYQDFNAWPSRPDVYTESTCQAVQQRFVNTFDGWATNADQVFRENIAAPVGSTNVFWRGPFLTPGLWTAGGAAYVSERLEADTNNKPAGVSGFRNLAVRLKGGDSALDLGYLYNGVASRPDGLGQVSFKCRLAQTAGAQDVAYSRNGFSATNYLVRATLQGHTLSPDRPSFSLVGYYQNPGAFYEYRVTLMPDPLNASSGRDARTYHQVFKWTNGVPSQVGGLVYIDNDPSLIGRGVTMEMRLYSSNNVSTCIRCKWGVFEKVVDSTDSASPILSGTYGFMSSESFVGFSSVYTQPTTTGAVATGTSTLVLDTSDPVTFDAQKANWYAPVGRFTLRRDVSPYGVYSVVPTQKVGLYLQESDRLSQAGPEASGSVLWKKLQEVTVPSFGYSSVTVPVRSWKPQFVKLQVAGSGADVVVDEVAVSSWRGGQVGDAGTNGWLASEAWVVSNSLAQAQVLQLDRTRADPSEAQGVRSPLLSKGLGAMAFDYRVLGAPAKLTVQYALASSPAKWADVASFAATNATSWTYALAHLGLLAPGYFRVVSTPVAGGSNTLVELNDVKVWDQPAAASSEWHAYNAKITATDTNRVSLDRSPVCFLNSGATPEADPVQDQSEPFVQSPVLPGGLGALSFRARAYAANQPASVAVYASTNGWDAPADRWFVVRRFDGITNTVFRPFSFETASGRDYDAVRLVNECSAGAPRVCLEDVAVAETPDSFADVVGLEAEMPQTTYVTSGTNIGFTVTLAGRCALRKSDAEATEARYPEIGVVVNGEQRWASLSGLAAAETAQGWRTEVRFRYAVKPGDLAEPLRLSMPVGAAHSADAYAFAWHGWEVFDQDSASNAVWRFNRSLMEAGDLYDPDLSSARVVLRTLSFDESSPADMAATESETWRVQTDRAVADEPVVCVVWSSDTNVVQVGPATGAGAEELVIGVGERSSAFAVRGVAPGKAELYVQRSADYARNAAAGVTNAVRRTVSVSVAPLKRWGEVAGTLRGGGLFKVGRCETDAGGASVVCDGGGGGAVFRFVGDRSVAFTNLTLAVSNGATVVVEDLNIDNSGAEGLSAVAAADAHPLNTLAVAGSCSMSGGRMAAGIRVAVTGGVANVLTVTSGAGTNGVLSVAGGILAAGIGGDPFVAGGALTVGGHVAVSALGGDFGAGVGGGIAAASESVEVGGAAVLMATGCGGARDVGPGAYCAGAAAVRFSGGLLLTGSGVDGVSRFATSRHASSSAGVFPASGWYVLTRDGDVPLGRMYVSAPEIGVHAISNVTQVGYYELEPVGGGAAVAFEIAQPEPRLPAGVRGDVALYKPWLQSLGLGSADLSAIGAGRFEAAWLLDQNPQTFLRGRLAITGVRLEAGTVKASYEVRADTTEGGRAVTRLNGRLVVLGADSVAGGFGEEIAEITATVGSGAFAFEVPRQGGCRFIKIAVLYPR